MDKLLDLSGSFVIGSILLLALIGFTIYYTGQSRDTQVDQIQHMNSIVNGDIIEYDFSKVGYRITGTNKILSISTHNITFLGDLDNNGVMDTVYYSMFNNSSKIYLKRRVSNLSNKEWSVPVQSFNIQGYDSLNNATSNISLIRSLGFEIYYSTVSSGYPNQEISAYWTRRFYPKNL